MTKRYIAYIDYFKNEITSLVLAEFDFKTLSKEDKDLLAQYQNGDSSLGEEILDSVRPTFYYYALDRNDMKPIIMVNKSDPENETWPVDIQNVYNTFEHAKSVFLKRLRSKNIERGMLLHIFSETI